MTVAVAVRSFEAQRISEAGLIESFAESLREAELFQGVMYPVPAGADPLFELQLLIRDEATEPDSNFWKSALVSLIFPLAFVVEFENDYVLHLEALLMRRQELVGSWSASAHIRHRYNAYANKQEMELEAVERVAAGVNHQIQRGLAADRELIAAATR